MLWFVCLLLIGAFAWSILRAEDQKSPRPTRTLGPHPAQRPDRLTVEEVEFPVWHSQFSCPLPGGVWYSLAQRPDRGSVWDTTGLLGTPLLSITMATNRERQVGQVGHMTGFPPAVYPFAFNSMRNHSSFDLLSNSSLFGRFSTDLPKEMAALCKWSYSNILCVHVCVCACVCTRVCVCGGRGVCVCVSVVFWNRTFSIVIEHVCICL